MGNDGPVNMLNELAARKKRGEKIDPNNLPDLNRSDNRLFDGRKKKVLRLPKKQSEYLHIVPIHEKEQNRVADDLLEWVRLNEEVINLSLFGVTFGYNFYELEGLVDKNPYFKEVFNRCAQIIATRLDKKAFLQNDSFVLHRRMWQYDRSFKESWKQEIDAKAKSSEDENINITFGEPPKPENWVDVREQKKIEKKKDTKTNP